MENLLGHLKNVGVCVNDDLYPFLFCSSTSRGGVEPLTPEPLRPEPLTAEPKRAEDSNLF